MASRVVTGLLPLSLAAFEQLAQLADLVGGQRRLVHEVGQHRPGGPAEDAREERAALSADDGFTSDFRVVVVAVPLGPEAERPLADQPVEQRLDRPRAPPLA